MAITKPVRGIVHRSLDWLAAQHATWSPQIYTLQNGLEPRFTGRADRTPDLLAGRFLVAGAVVTAPSIWRATAKDIPASDWAHGFEWLADLAADGTAPARDLAVRWLDEWTKKYGRGAGPAWSADGAGRRVIHMIMQVDFLFAGQSKQQNEMMRRLWAAHGVFLHHRGQTAQNPIARLENAIARALLPIVLDMPPSQDEPQDQILSLVCDIIDGEGCIPSRDAASLLYVLELALMGQDILAWHTQPIPDALRTRLDQMAQNLRTLRLSSGHLPRMQSTGRGNFGRLDHALERAMPHVQAKENAMGFMRLSAGRSTVILDIGAAQNRASDTPPHSKESLLAIEFSAGRDVILSPAQNGLLEWSCKPDTIPAVSPFCGLNLKPPHQLQTPSYIPAQQTHSRDGLHFEGAHDGWAASCGLTHLRQLDMDPSGLILRAEDQLLCLNKDGHDRFAAIGKPGVEFDITFHLHPSCTATQRADSIRIKTAAGYIWEFQTQGPVQIALLPSVWQAASHIMGRPSHCIHLNGRATGPVTRITWQFARLPQTP